MWDVYTHVYDLFIVLLHKQISSKLQYVETFQEKLIVIEGLCAMCHLIPTQIANL